MRTLIFTFMILSAGRSIRGADFCGLTVDIINPDGGPARLTEAKFFAPDGRLVLEKNVEGPTLQICDFGFGEHKLVLGSGNCFPLAFEGLRLRLDEPIRLIAHLNWCSKERFPGNLCSVYLRIRGPEGSPISGAALTWAANTKGGLSDALGRLGAVLVGGESTTATVVKPGYSPEVFRLRCEASQDIEMQVTLRPK